jgi:arsenate reductase
VKIRDRITCCMTLLAVMPMHLGVQAAERSGKTVLFVCEHGTVRSLLAKVLFERYAAEVGLPMRAMSRGTRVDSVVPSFMQNGLA